MVLSEWFITWMEQYKKNRVKSGTYYNYKKYFDSMIKGRLGDKKVSDIRGEHIQRFYNELEKEGYALSSIKIVSAILNGCMQQAMTKEQQARLEEAVDRAEEKGMTESLVMVDDLAFILNVKNKTIVTAVNDTSNAVFTNIDGAIIN